MSEASILDARSSNAKPNHARDARARAWAFAFECYRKKKGARPGAPDDGTESKEDSADAPIIQD
jgi:hypothetical protein